MSISGKDIVKEIVIKGQFGKILKMYWEFYKEDNFLKNQFLGIWKSDILKVKGRSEWKIFLNL